MKTIEFKRLERRFIVPKEAMAPVLKELDRTLKRLFYDKEIVQTVYLNNDDLPASWTCSLKARRYLKNPAETTETVDIDPEELFKCELKKDGAKDQAKIKTKNYLTIPGFCSWAAARLKSASDPAPLRPHILSQYRRFHFTLKGNSEMRVTADMETGYGFFPQDRPFVWIGKEDGLRVEIKTTPEMINGTACKKIINLLQQHGALPVISKKGQAYNLHARYLNRQFGSKMQKELINTEAEAKFLIDHPQPSVFFLEIKKALQSGKIPGFCFGSYPYVHSGNSINFYWNAAEEKAANELKLLFKGLFFRAVTK